MNNFNINNLEFDCENHEYIVDGKKVPGVTKVLEFVLFGDKYSNIPDWVLEDAARYGTLIHEEISNYLINGEEGFTEELQNFKKITQENDIEWIASELQIASSELAGTLDLIGKIKNSIILVDVKTTYKIDHDYVSWQLSLYKYILNKIRPDIKITDFYVLWLKNEKYKFEKVNQKTDEEVLHILDCFKKGVKIDFSTTSLQTIPEDKLELFCTILEQIEDMEEQIKETKQKILEEMENNNLKSVDLGNIKISYTAPTETTSVDTEKLKEEGIYEKYSKKSRRKSSISIKIKR